jgi:diguanylate cyclase (GGDEF)-like protein
VRYQIIGWVPGIFCGIDIVSAAFGFTVQPVLPDIAPFVTMGFEVAITGIGVINRLQLLREERDEALQEARTLEELSERDPMTGLLNRRAIDSRFGDLHQSGYDTFAVIDLDDFKQVNDVAGHSKGDEVLKVVASVMKKEQNCITIRLGGEEFLLLLKGADAFERAERLRQTIPVRIAREVSGLEQIVTASMGLIEIPRGAMPNAGFADIYSHADRLLYEAKEQGRNRTVSEKMRGFRKRSSDRRQRNAA